MSVLSVKCPTCKDDFGDSQNIYATSCGHLYHSSCLKEWKTQGVGCPECQFYRLFLSFDESEEDLEKIQKLKEELQTSNEVITSLLVEVDETEANFLALHKQFSGIENSKRKLEERIKQLKESENNFMRLQGQYTETSELSLKLEGRINELLIENEYKSEKLRLKKLENQSLKSNCEERKINICDSKFIDKIDILTHKLKHISEELEREIAASSQLSIDIMKLQSCIDQLKSREETKVAESKKNKRQPNRRTRNNKNTTGKNEKTLDKNDKVTTKAVLIKNLPLDLITIPLENIIIKLASKMDLSVSSDDFTKVNLLHTEEQNFSKAEMLAEFKNGELGDKFVSNKDILKNDPQTESVIICYFEDNPRPQKGLNIIKNSAGNVKNIFNDQEDKIESKPKVNNGVDEYFYKI